MRGQFGGIDQVAEHDRELAPFGVRRWRCGWGDQRSRVVCVLCSLLGRWREGSSRRLTRFPGPHQHSPVLVDREVLGLNEFLFEGFEGFIIQLELVLERTLRHTLTLTEEGSHLIEDSIKVNRVP